MAVDNRPVPAMAMLPTYNEADNIRPLIEALLDSADGMEVVVVDDHITGVVSEHQAGKVLGWPDTGIKVKGRKSTAIWVLVSQDSCSVPTAAEAGPEREKKGQLPAWVRLQYCPFPGLKLIRQIL